MYKIYVILIILIIIIISNIYIYIINGFNYEYNSYEKIDKIALLLTNCSINNKKRIRILNNIDYVKYLNYLSCECKGIGYWGGFCLKKYNKYIGGNEDHDISLSNELAQLFRDKSVVDLGSGLGWYCPIISKKSKICDQYDGSVNIEEVTNGKVKFLNLAEPINFECHYDIVMSIEVAEHIPKLYENIYINNLIKCSKEAILITWSRVGQKGHFHVNNKNKEEVINIFENKGFKYQPEITIKLINKTKIYWIKNNLLYFVKMNKH